MSRIRYTRKEQYDFATQFLKLLQRDGGPRIQQSDVKQEIEVANTTIARLFQRIADEQKAVILPSYSKQDKWLLAAPNYQKLEQALNRLQHFLVPTYASFGKAQVPVHENFTDKNDVQKLGDKLYPAGYYTFQSTKELRQEILNALELWMQLEDIEPEPEPEDEYLHASYGTLYENFKLAISTLQWDEADRIRQIIRSQNMTTAENHLFLEIEQLAQQQNWSSIWNTQYFQELAGTRIPRAVRGALLTAFHQTILFPLEQQGKWQEALDNFEVHLPLLGLLLTSRVGFTQTPIVKVFAYQAVFEKKREALLNLTNVNQDQATLFCITKLLDLLGHETQTFFVKPERSPFILAREALDDADYDTALDYALQVEQAEEKAFLLLQIAFLSTDMVRTEVALTSYSRLTEQQQKNLKKRFPAIGRIHQELQNQIQHLVAEGNQQEQPPITDWISWFARIQSQPNDPALINSLEYLGAISDERFLTFEHVKQLSDALIVLDQSSQQHPLVRDALQKIAPLVFSDESFPRTDSIYQTLYESLYIAFLAKNANKEMQIAIPLQLLTDAMLQVSPDRCYKFSDELQEWCGKPIPKLDAWAIETFELLIEYGLEPPLLEHWFRLWISDRDLNILKRESGLLEAWFRIGQLIDPQSDLVKKLKDYFSNPDNEEEKNIFSKLPDGYRIGIYTLYESAATRVHDVLLQYNPHLEILICTSKVLTENAKAIAQNSDLIVQVTAAMKHSLYYGLEGLIDDKKIIYHHAKGTTGIIRAIEEHIKRLQGE